MKKPQRGRPPTGQNPALLLTLPADLLKRVDRWRDDQFEDMGRQEAIRRLLERALARRIPKR
jgi:metal-responsive CopG/Arc/MetJ family transcriptional regulator